MTWKELEAWAKRKKWNTPETWTGVTCCFAETSSTYALARGFGKSIPAAKRALCRAVEKIREAE